MYLHVLYKDDVDVGDMERALPSEDDIPSHPQEWCRMAKVYILAEKLRDIDSINALIDGFRDADSEANMPFAVEVISVIVNNTTAKSASARVSRKSASATSSSARHWRIPIGRKMMGSTTKIGC